jgi:hypothetical protein
VHVQSHISESADQVGVYEREKEARGQKGRTGGGWGDWEWVGGGCLEERQDFQAGRISVYTYIACVDGENGVVDWCLVLS